jgi:hypothetical protein
MLRLTTCTALALLATTPTCWAQERYSFGVGAGATYSGLGIAVGKHSERTMQYGSLGCMAIEDGGNSVCGISMGAFRSDLLGTASDRHGLGLHLGLVGAGRPEPHKDLKPAYGIGLTYAYFWNGITQPGFNFGFTPALGYVKGDASGYFTLQIGYQF